MNFEELQNMIDYLNANGKTRFLKPATSEQIAEFENINEIKLPDLYKEWLLFSDGGELFLPAGLQLYGVVNNPTIHFDDSDRPNDKYVIIGALATGDPILCEKDSEKVSIYNREAGRIEDDEIYEDFFALLNDLEGILGIGE